MKENFPEPVIGLKMTRNEKGMKENVPEPVLGFNLTSNEK